MKKYALLLLVFLFVLTVSVFQSSCKHELPLPSCSETGFKITATGTPATGNQNNGTITAAASGGSGFKFSLNGGPFQDTGYFTGLEPFRNYNVVGKNSLGCTDTVILQVGSADPCQGVTILLTLTATEASPNQSNGSITAVATGGTGFTFSLNGGSFQSSGTFTNLAAGNYTVTARNASGCMGSAQITVATSNPCAGITVTVTTTVIQPGNGQSNGSITATATGGTGFTYSLNGGAFQASGTFTGLAAGNYTITAKNANGCTGVTTVALGNNNPCAGITVVVTASTVNPTAGSNNGTITATATGGSGFTYSLNGGTYQASGTFTGLAAGTYTVTAKNSNGCIGSTQVTLTPVNPCSNTSIVITTVVVNTTPCTTPANNGSITVSATGSTGFMYNLNGGAYQASNVFANLTTGNFTVGVKDLNNCTQTQAAVVGTVPKGQLFTSVRTLITNRCGGSGCHMNGGNAAGYNFDPDCNIVSNWSQINRATVLYTLTKMPKSPQPLFTAAEKLIITNWVNAGHRYTD